MKSKNTSISERTGKPLTLADGLANATASTSWLLGDIQNYRAEHAALLAVAEASANLLVWLNEGGATKKVWPQGQEQYDVRNALAELAAVREGGAK